MISRSLGLSATVFGVLVGPGQPLEGQQDTAAVDTIFAAWNRPDSPGCALGVLNAGHVVYAKGYGAANLATGAPITPQTIFYMASVSKQFTAATAALLALDDSIGLDDDVRRYVPELPEYGSPITIRHLIHHTSGLRDYLTLMPLARMEYDDRHSAQDILTLIARQRGVNFPSGDRYLYSNTGYFLIPVIVQRVADTSFRAFADERIFRPLNMTSSHFHDDHTHEVPRRALSYRKNEDGTFELAFLDKFDQVGSGGLLTNIEDMAKWDGNYYQPRVGGPTFVELTHSRGVLNEGDTLDYAFGLQIDDYKGLRSVRHGGSMMGFRTHYLRFPEERLSVVCLCNLNEIDPGPLAERVADVYLAHRFAVTLAPYTGVFRSDELATVWTLRIEGADLILDRRGEERRALAHEGGDAFRIPDGPRLEFRRDASGRVTSFVVNAGRATGMRFVR